MSSLDNVKHTAWNVPYLPLPNRVDITITDELAPVALTRTAFMIPVFDDGSLLLAMNTRRGMEIPGGHIDPGETMLEAAMRETMEEVGCTVTDVVPIGYLHMQSDGMVPEDYPYPHPISYQQFFAGRVSEVFEYTPNDECDKPVRLYGLNADLQTRLTTIILGQHARDLLTTNND